ncbi:hypothetical protein Belba_1031 [Belliella baltica DSM 15883]|uniref:Uncharacterized protein n=1 Tax=Belliella baltica (strain DSM 15883 / CIP 108006 / LMG 21964 / BA134) TaxID=866536 RepID=I3Z354_BELBD|nr:hypothetical protein Belba_1031 [Belliella baltica DSM 15883]
MNSLLRQYKIIDNYQIYQSDFNQLVFVIHDEENDLYYRLERTNTEIEKTDLNLRKWIEILFKM